MPSTPIKVDDLLRARGVSQRELGELLGLSQPAVNRRLQGTVEFRLSELRKISSTYDVQLAELFDD